jgi:DNA-binding CsgD family transcriptional regulator
MALRSLILSIGAKDEGVQKTLEKLGALGAKTKDDLAKIASDVNTKAAEKQIDDLAAAIKRQQTNTDNLATAARQTSTGIELVGGVSRLTKTELDQVNKTLQTGLDAYRALGQEAPKDLQNIADAVARQKEALSGTGKTLGGVTEQSGLLGKATSLLSGQLLALAGPAALGAAAKQALDYADNLVKMSDRTGIGVVALQRLEAIAKASGNSIEDIAGAVNKFQKGIAEGNLDKPIERLGLSVAALRAQSPDEQFIAIAKAIQQIPDPAEQARAAMELFGRSGGELLPSLKADVDTLADSTIKMSADSVRALDEFGDAIGRWKTNTINGIGEVLGKLLSLPGSIRDAQANLDKLGPATPNLSQSRVLATLEGEQPGGSAAVAVDDLTDSFSALIEKVPSAVQQVKSAQGAFLPMGVAAISASDAVKQSNAQFGTLDDQLKKIGANIEAARVLEAINKKITEGQRPVIDLTDRQKELTAQYKEFGLSAQEIGTKLGVSARSVDAYTTSLKLHADVLRTVESASFGLTGSVGPLTENLAASASEMAKLHTKISGIEEDAHVAAFGFKGMADGLGAVGTKSTELEDVKEHLKDSADQAKRNAEEAAKAGKGISDLAQAFAQLSQVSGGSLGEVVQEIGNVISALDLATKAVKAYGEASTLASKAAAVASGIAAGAQATGSGSTISRVGGGALTGCLDRVRDPRYWDGDSVPASARRSV